MQRKSQELAGSSEDTPFRYDDYTNDADLRTALFAFCLRPDATLSILDTKIMAEGGAKKSVIKNADTYHVVYKYPADDDENNPPTTLVAYLDSNNNVKSCAVSVKHGATYLDRTP